MLKTNTKKKKSETEINDEELKLLLATEGKKLGLLIGYADLPQKMKLELVSLLPSMTPAQLERLVEVLEANYLNEATRDIDEEFKVGMESLVDFFKEKKNNPKE